MKEHFTNQIIYAPMQSSHFPKKMGQFFLLSCCLRRNKLLSIFGCFYLKQVSLFLCLQLLHPTTFTSVTVTSTMPASWVSPWPTTARRTPSASTGQRTIPSSSSLRPLVISMPAVPRMWSSHSRRPPPSRWPRLWWHARCARSTLTSQLIRWLLNNFALTESNVIYSLCHFILEICKVGDNYFQISLITNS